MNNSCCCKLITDLSGASILIKWSDKLRAILAKITIVKNKIPYSTLLILYKALGETTLYYGLSSCGGTCKSHLEPIYIDCNWDFLKQLLPSKLKLNIKNWNYLITVKFCPYTITSNTFSTWQTFNLNDNTIF